MTVEPIVVPSVEQILVAYLKSRDEVLDHVAEARIASRHPSSVAVPWLRIMALPGRTLVQRPRAVVEAHAQIEAYGGDTAAAQAEAHALAEAVASVLVVVDEDPDFTFDGGIVTAGVLLTEPWRFPDPDFTPARERYLFDVAVTVTAT